MNKKIYFAAYINVGNLSRQKAMESVRHFMDTLKSGDDSDNERFFVIPVRDQDTRLELLYPTPAVTQDQVDIAFEKYQKRISELTEKIKEL